MKSLLKISTIVLILTYITLTLLGNKGEYAAEKKMWAISKEYGQITKDPKSVPAANFDKVIEKFDRFTRTYPNSKLVPTAQIRAGRLFALRKDYKSSRARFEDMIKQYSDSEEIGVRAVSEIGRTYADEEDWANVTKTHERIIRDYPETRIGLISPIMMAGFQAEKNGILAGEKSYDAAIEHYQRLADKSDNPVIQFRALRLKALSLMVRKRWQECVQTLGKILNEYADDGVIDVRTADDIIKTINTVSVTYLNDIDLPISIYQEFIDKHPNSQVIAIFEEIIRSLKAFKNLPTG